MTAAQLPQLNLAVQYAVSAIGKPTRAHFRKWVHAALDHDARVTLRIVGQKEGRTLNRSYRNKDYATNVLTFIFNDKPPFEGDLALCAPVVAREARAQKKSLAAHYAHLTVHGVLHLQGYDHETEPDAQVMEQRETLILAKLGYADPY
ncbi:MAG: rRNA maturation RNase YbeY [Burkholderiales bacterium]